MVFCDNTLGRDSRLGMMEITRADVDDGRDDFVYNDMEMVEGRIMPARGSLLWTATCRAGDGAEGMGKWARGRSGKEWAERTLGMRPCISRLSAHYAACLGGQSLSR